MEYVCKINMCTGCKVCLEACKQNAITILDDIESNNALIDEKRCIGCNLCRKVCPQIERVQRTMPIGWIQGWTNENIRRKSTSGGFCTAIMISFIRKGGFVCACKFCDGEYKYILTNKENEIDSFSGSKYVKSNPIGIYSLIDKALLEGNNVLFVGLPCHVAALKNYIRNATKLYTIELICHGTPSLQLLRLYLNEEVKNSSIDDIRFRLKDNYDNYEYKPIISPYVLDYYTLAFLKGLSFTENCYSCQYATIERVSDLMLGDSWGSELPKEEQKKGISLAFYQNEKGKELLESANLYMYEVDLERAKSFNSQLNGPVILPASRNIFMKQIKKNKRFKIAIKKALPKVYLTQCLKLMLIKIKLKKSTNMQYNIWIKN